MTVIVTFQMAGDQGLDWGFWRGDEKVNSFGVHWCKQITWTSGGVDSWKGLLERRLKKPF